MNKMTDGAAGNGARDTIQEGIRKIAAKMLESGEAQVFIGYEAGTLPLRTTPAFVTCPEDAVRFVWTPFCENNLTVYLPEYKEMDDVTVGLIVKGCDVRTLVNLILENQISRDRVKIIGVPCEGVIDRAKVAKVLGTDRIIRDSKVAGLSLVLEGDGFEVEIEIEDVLADPCEACRHPVPARSAPAYEHQLQRNATILGSHFFEDSGRAAALSLESRVTADSASIAVLSSFASPLPPVSARIAPPVLCGEPVQSWAGFAV
jgi:hypothetical protein